MHVESYSSEYLTSGDSDAWIEWTCASTLCRMHENIENCIDKLLVTKKRSLEMYLRAYCCRVLRAATSAECRCPKRPRVHVKAARKGEVKSGRDVIRTQLSCTGRSINEGYCTRVTDGCSDTGDPLHPESRAIDRTTIVRKSGRRGDSNSDLSNIRLSLKSSSSCFKGERKNVFDTCRCACNQP